MRFDTPVFFQHITTRGSYNSDTGNYNEDDVEEVEVLASVTDSGDETKKLLYGDITQDSKTVRIQNHYERPFDSIRIGKDVYKVDLSRKLRTKHTFVVREVQ